jgi:uncharacterized protein YkwD
MHKVPASMSMRTQGALTRLIALAALGTALLIAPAAGATSGGTEAEPQCTGTAVAPKRATLSYLSNSVLCLVNRARIRYGLPPLAESPQLHRSATGHSLDMVSHDYFSHDGPTGSTLGTRVASAGYLARVSSFTVGENIGGGGGRRAGSPIAVFRSWMHSPPHRANILDPDFHDAGVGVARGYPRGGGLAAATYTLDLGRRH